MLFCCVVTFIRVFLKIFICRVLSLAKNNKHNSSVSSKLIKQFLLTGEDLQKVAA